MDFIRDETKELLSVLLSLLAVVALIIGTIAWFDGHAKSAYIKRFQGVDIPWYQATWLEVQVNGVSIDKHVEKQ